MKSLHSGGATENSVVLTAAQWAGGYAEALHFIPDLPIPKTRQIVSSRMFANQNGVNMFRASSIDEARTYFALLVWFVSGGLLLYHNSLPLTLVPSLHSTKLVL